MPINPNQLSQWRPKSDLGRTYDVIAVSEPFEPKDRADAVAYVLELALPHITCYDGHKDVQADLLEEEAKLRFPSLFAIATSSAVQLQNKTDLAPTPVQQFFEDRRKPNGQIDWNAVSRDTVYAVSSTKCVTDDEQSFQVPEPRPATGVDLSSQVA